MVTSGEEAVSSMAKASDRLTGTPRVIATPVGMITVSDMTGTGVIVGCRGTGIEDEGLEAIASCRRHRTSSALARSIGA